jgi:Amt family ammonium transporter
MLSAAAGGATALLFTLFRYNRSDAPSVINGSLAGLVGITAGSAYVSDLSAIFIGVVAGLLMIFAANWTESLGIDDPVGAFPVHGISGVWGTFAVGLFSTNGGLFPTGHWHLLEIQTIGLVVLALWGFFMTRMALLLIKKIVPVRATEEEEELGLDISYHGIMAAYVDHDFITLEQTQHFEPELKKENIDTT